MCYNIWIKNMGATESLMWAQCSMDHVLQRMNHEYGHNVIGNHEYGHNAIRNREYGHNAKRTTCSNTSITAMGTMLYGPCVPTFITKIWAQSYMDLVLQHIHHEYGHNVKWSCIITHTSRTWVQYYTDHVLQRMNHEYGIPDLPSLRSVRVAMAWMGVSYTTGREYLRE